MNRIENAVALRATQGDEHFSCSFFRFSSINTLALLFIATLFGCSPAPKDNTTVLTYGSPYSPTHPFSRADRTWMDWIKKESQGTMRVQPYWSGSLLSSEHSMTELRHGVVDIGLITPIYARGGTHMIRAQAGYYGGLTTFTQQVALYRCMEKIDPQFASELHDLVVLAVQGGNLPGIVTRKKAVQSLNDLQGMRLRAPAELLPVLKHLGADPVDMPMGEVYSALAKGVLDGVVAPADTLKSMHFAEVAHYYNNIAIPRGAYAARAMGAQRWKTLSQDQQALLTRSVQIWEDALREELNKAVAAGEKEGHDLGIEFATMGAEETQRFLSIYNEFAENGARRLERYDINGLATFQYARKLAADAGAGEVVCKGEK